MTPADRAGSAVLEDDLLSPDVTRDPHPYFHRLRAEDPVHWNELWGGWVLTRYDDVLAAFRDPRFSSDRFTSYLHRRTDANRSASNATFRMLSEWMVFRDPPDHTRLRLFVNKAFTPRVIEGLRPLIERTVDDLLTEVVARDRCDLVWDFAYPLPAIVIAGMLGVVLEDCDRLKAWSDELATIVHGALRAADRHERAQQSTREMAAHFHSLIHERRTAPHDDLISALIAAEHKGSLLSEDEIVATCILLLFAGHETTTNFIGNAVLALLQQPERLAELRGQPQIGVAAVDELLRFDGPVKATIRWATGDVELRGRRIERGQRILLVQSAANRDPERFPEPDRLDFTRRDNQHVAFGYGIHYCLGAPLARVEVQLALQDLLQRFPKLRLHPDLELEWHPTAFARGLKSLPVLI
ncbi:MAG: cytochrome P450 [Chloroflexi bacterium]|nr:cytochrome P450 [Chloroflexota bacterium]